MELQKKTVEWNVRRFAFLDQEPERDPRTAPVERCAAWPI